MRFLGLMITLALTAVVAQAGASPWRSRFLDEALEPHRTHWTGDFHAYFADSYTVDKLELARLLPERASQRGKRLRALLVVGPVGMLWTYWVWTFVDEGDAVRVTVITMPHARITAKATARISRSELERFAERLGNAGVEQGTTLERIERTAASQSHDGDAEWGFELLFVQWADTARLLHARLDWMNGDETIDVVNDAVGAFGVRTTYVHGDRDLSPLEKPRHSAEVFIGPTLAQGSQPGLDDALVRTGYTRLPTSEIGLCLGMDVVLDRWRFGFELARTLSRDAWRIRKQQCHEPM